MPANFIKFAFVAGEIAENYHFRSDLDKYDLALALAENWFVDYRGGISTRPGTEFIDYIENDTLPARLIPYSFASNVANTAVLQFGDKYLRILQQGAYVTNLPASIAAITQTNPLTVNAPGNGLSFGDLVKITGILGMPQVVNQTYKIIVDAGNILTLGDIQGNPIDATLFNPYISGGVISRVVKFTSPYAGADLAQLKYTQRRDVVRLTHPNYPVYNLRRLATDNWTFTQETFGRTISPPTIASVIPGAAGTFGTMYQVSAVDASGNESTPSIPFFITTVQDPTTVDGWTTLVNWSAVSGALYYKLYRSRVVAVPNLMNAALEVGYIGQSRGTSFTDQFVLPDYTRIPTRADSPFADGQVTQVAVLTGGATYPANAYVTATDATGSGFLGLCVIQTTVGAATGPIVGISILNPGMNYTNPTLVINNAGAGAGATFSTTLGTTGNNNPVCSAIFQQRQIYAGLGADPLAFYASKSGLLSNFDVPDIVHANDSYGFELDNEDAGPILYAVPTRGGLMLFTATGFWLFSGIGGQAASPGAALAEPQSFTGIIDVPPLKVENSLLIAELAAVKYLSYNDISKIYGGVDVSILSNHLFAQDKQIINWCYAKIPYKLIYATRTDGTMLTLTLLKDQDVYAWTRYTTQGLFKQVIALQEDAITATYAIVSRYINGQYRQYIETFSQRNFDKAEDFWCVDAGLNLSPNYPNTTLAFSDTSGVVNATAGMAVFGSQHIGAFIRGGGARGIIQSITSASIAVVELLDPLTQVIPQTNIPQLLQSGDWTLDIPVSTLYGLNHLEGQAVTVLADGNVVTGLTVTNGTITLPTPASRVVVGLNYTCTLKTLPPVMPGARVEGKLKNIVGIVTRVKDTRGLTAGTDPNHTYLLKERTTEVYNSPIALQDGFMQNPVEPGWSYDIPIYFIQSNPLPATLLGYAADLDMEDGN